jgi:hypothetical protein
VCVCVCVCVLSMHEALGSILSTKTQKQNPCQPEVKSKGPAAFKFNILARIVHSFSVHLMQCPLRRCIVLGL